MAGAQPLLLHSLVEFDELIHACLDAAQCAHGAGDRIGVRRLHQAAARRRSRPRRRVCGASSPAPTRELEDADRDDPAFHLVRGLSPAALAKVPACDAYVIDGDHNYWTVAAELAHVAEQTPDGGHHPLTILHDVAWPCGRRDLYYAPEAVPSEGVHPHTWELGTVPGASEAVPGGFRGRGSFAIALHEGGERNGVRTAVEDHAARHGGLRFAVVPAVFGLGVLFAEAAPYAGKLDELLGGLDASPLLERMERNRLELYLAVLGAQQDVSELGLRQGRLLAEYDTAIARTETEAAALRHELAALKERLGRTEERPRRTDRRARCRDRPSVL